MSLADCLSTSTRTQGAVALVRTSMMFLLFTIVVVQSVTGQSGGGLPTVRVVATGGTIAGEQFETGTLGKYQEDRERNRSHGSAYRAIRKSGDGAVLECAESFHYSERLVETGPTAQYHFERATTARWHRHYPRHEPPRRDCILSNLTVRSDRPIVVVGAQRPPTGISPDGPINLLSAVRVAASTGARGKGVTVVMDDRIIAAREAVKIFPRSGGFEGAEMGVLGTVSQETVEFFYQPVRKHTSASEFDVNGELLQELPTVGISYSYAGAGDDRG